MDTMASSILAIDAAKVLQAVCMCSSLFLMGSGIPEVLLPSIKSRSIPHGKSVLPYVAMLVDTVTGMFFTKAIGDGLGFSLRSLSLVLTVAYLAAFGLFASGEVRQKMVGQLVMAGTGLTAAMTSLYLFTSSAKLAWLPGGTHHGAAMRAEILGLMGTITAIGFAASPLADIKKVLKNKVRSVGTNWPCSLPLAQLRCSVGVAPSSILLQDASSIPRIMMTVLLICATSWALYGALYLKNMWVVVPNVINAILAFVQLALAAVFPSPQSGRSPASRAPTTMHPPVASVSGLRETISDVATAADEAVQRILKETGPPSAIPFSAAIASSSGSVTDGADTMASPTMQHPQVGALPAASSAPVGQVPLQEMATRHEKERHGQHHHHHGHRDRSRSRSKGVRERRKSTQSTHSTQ
jgi:Sugar efflux transporter for intercellular exchange